MFSVSSAVVLWLVALQAPSAGVLGEPFESARSHVRFRPPAGWHQASEEPLEFWKADEYGPRIQIAMFPYELSDPSNIEDAQKELSYALTQQFPDLDIHNQRQLTHRGHPAIEVMATLEIGNTFYHVIQRCLFAEGRIYIITGASFEASFLEDLPVFRTSMDSVEVLSRIFNLDSEGAVSLIDERQLGAMAVGLVVFGFILRRISLAKLKRMQR
jgi:hypothetical protein